MNQEEEIQRRIQELEDEIKHLREQEEERRKARERDLEEEQYSALEPDESEIISEESLPESWTQEYEEPESPHSRLQQRLMNYDESTPLEPAMEIEQEEIPFEWSDISPFNDTTAETIQERLSQSQDVQEFFLHPTEQEEIPNVWNDITTEQIQAPEETRQRSNTEAGRLTFRDELAQEIEANLRKDQDLNASIFGRQITEEELLRNERLGLELDMERIQMDAPLAGGSLRDSLTREIETRIRFHPEFYQDLGTVPDQVEHAQDLQDMPHDWSDIYEHAYIQDLDQAIQDYANMNDQQLNASLDVPKGDIDNNARQAIEELDIDTKSVMEEIQQHNQMQQQQRDMQKQEKETDFDFGH